MIIAQSAAVTSRGALSSLAVTVSGVRRPLTSAVITAPSQRQSLVETFRISLVGRVAAVAVVDV